jgi:hypothetical protein
MPWKSAKGAGQLTASEWRERAAKAHGTLEQPTLFSSPLVSLGTPAETHRDEIEKIVAAAAKLKAAEAVVASERKMLWQART